jgi:hypothetical protein
MTKLIIAKGTFGTFSTKADVILVAFNAKNENAPASAEDEVLENPKAGDWKPRAAALLSAYSHDAELLQSRLEQIVPMAEDGVAEVHTFHLVDNPANTGTLAARASALLRAIPGVNVTKGPDKLYVHKGKIGPIFRAPEEGSQTKFTPADFIKTFQPTDGAKVPKAGDHWPPIRKGQSGMNDVRFQLSEW